MLRLAQRASGRSKSVRTAVAAAAAAAFGVANSLTHTEAAAPPSALDSKEFHPFKLAAVEVRQPVTAVGQASVCGFESCRWLG
jgi:hypothetical protein